MAEQIKTVTVCNTCPYARAAGGGDHAYCRLLGRQHGHQAGGAYAPPDTCPLRTGDIVLRLDAARAAELDHQAREDWKVRNLGA